MHAAEASAPWSPRSGRPAALAGVRRPSRGPRSPTPRSCSSRCSAASPGTDWCPHRAPRRLPRADAAGHRGPQGAEPPGRLLPGLGFDTASWRADCRAQDAPAGPPGRRRAPAPATCCAPSTGRRNSRTASPSSRRASAGREISIAIVARRGAPGPGDRADRQRPGEAGRAARHPEAPRTWPAGCLSHAPLGAGRCAGQPRAAHLVDVGADGGDAPWRVATGEPRRRTSAGRSDIVEFAGRSVRSSAYRRFCLPWRVISVSLWRAEPDSGAAAGRLLGGLPAGRGGPRKHSRSAHRSSATPSGSRCW